MQKEQHGDTGTNLYTRWLSMRARVSPKWNDRRNYYDRGITICKEWDSYLKFKSWAILNGYNEKLEIDRIDNNKGYSPDNCRWITHRLNNLNRRDAITVIWEGETRSVALVCESLGMSEIHRKAIINRILRGWDKIKAITTPVFTDKYTSPKTTPVINTKTNKIYNTLKEASVDANIHSITLSKMLRGIVENTTSFMYYKI